MMTQRPRRRRRPPREPPPTKTPLEKWIGQQGAVIWRLLIFIPISLLIVNMVVDRFSDSVQIGIFTALLASILFIMVGKWPLK